ncbi:ComEC family competence protein [Robertkochia marina]|uniref:ComEC family competence protein n=1 Tax=Robertkochia marina TaxID=1227945 RepID=A0A4S3M190_9FLAO|nr:ComEC/Rec2 family competence protein [Robertkochia marina]THD68842.1 ComEC family competence protein [Robertkochia marina]TRZ43916.1 ComEC family competence protein [Robertkochia marina]
MKLLNIALLKLLVYLTSGIMAGYLLPEAINTMPVIPVGAFLCCILALSFLYNRKHYFEVVCGLLFLTIGIYSCQTQLTPPRSFIATFINKPIAANIYVQQELPATKYRYRYIGTVNPIHYSQSPLQAILEIPKTSKNVQSLTPGLKYLSVARVNYPAPPPDPIAFNYREYLRKKGIHLIAEINPASVSETGKPSPVRFWMFRLKNHLTGLIEDQSLDPLTLGLIKALILGDRSELSPEFYNSLRAIGGAHLIALSGLHIGILVSFTSFLLWPLRRFKNGGGIHFVLLSVFLTFYIFLVGASASVVRAGVMCVFLSFSILLQDRISALNTVITSAFILLVFHPLYLFDVGFQLSYAALAGIFLLRPIFDRIWKPKNRVIRFIWGLITISFPAQLFTAPLTLYYFHQFPVAFLLTNLMLTPLIMLFLPVAYLGSLAFIGGIVPGLFVLLINYLARIINYITGALQFESVFSEYVINLQPVQVLVLYAFLFIVVRSVYRKQYLMLIPMCIIFIQIRHLSENLLRKPDQLVISHHYKKSEVNITRNGLQQSHHYSREGSAFDIADSKEYFFKIGNESLLVITTNQFKFPDLPTSSQILLTNSTQINMDRLLNDLRPSRVIADGSNYPELVSRWRLSCMQKNIPFHYTGEKGYYIIKTSYGD